MRAIEKAARESGTPVRTMGALAAHLRLRNKEAGKKPATTIPLREQRTRKLEEGFKRLGLSTEGAGVAARGRAGRPRVGGLLEAGRALGLVPAAARAFARGRHGLSEAVTKNEPADGSFKGGDFTAGDYAYVGDAQDPSTWSLLLTLTPGGTPDPDSVKSAVQAIDPANPADNPVPDSALPDVKAALVKAWTQAGLRADTMPEILTREALRRAFIHRGLSETAAAIAARGRRRS